MGRSAGGEGRAKEPGAATQGGGRRGVGEGEEGGDAEENGEGIRVRSGGGVSLTSRYIPGLDPRAFGRPSSVDAAKPEAGEEDVLLKSSSALPLTLCNLFRKSLGNLRTL